MKPPYIERYARCERTATSHRRLLEAEENQTRKILELLNESKDLEEAKEKVKSLLDK